LQARRFGHVSSCLDEKKSMNRIERIRAVLEKTFEPARLEIVDESHLHAGHAGASTGRGHYRVQIVSHAFAGKSPIQRHRMVYEALGEQMQTEIHALSIRAETPDP
jgi:BolA family transcriptional regulator, general stress-responsive regulator